jgi:pimeloyl-ACP methyl ester carboxylesterase
MKEILFLHDALGSGEQFANLDTVLAGKFKIYTFNFSGHGRRPSHQHAFTVQNFTHEVLDWMNEQYIHSIDILGYGLGGYVALWLARFYPGCFPKKRNGVNTIIEVYLWIQKSPKKLPEVQF